MERLAIYISEAVKENNGKFEHYTETFEELTTKIPWLNDFKYKNELNNYLEDVIKAANFRPKELYIYALSKNYFKISYSYADYLVSCAEKYNNLFQVKHRSKLKYDVYYQKHKLFETGSGSIGKISTPSQERATCQLWNTCMNYIKQNTNFNIKNIDIDLVSNIVSDLSSNFDDEWKLTFKKQVNIIANYIEDLGGNIGEYTLDRFGEGTIGKMYSDFVHKYTKVMSDGGGQKDNYDPSDIVLFKSTVVDKIESQLKKLNDSIIDIDSALNAKNEYFNKLFKENLVQGISLKKIYGNKEGNREMFNVGIYQHIGSVTDFKISKYNDKEIDIICNGHFDFDKMINSEGELLNKESQIKLVIRSFGYSKKGQIIAMDATIMDGKNPSLGKCPLRMWSKLIGLKQNTNLTETVQTFYNYITNLDKKDHKQVLKDLQKLIAWSAKEGIECFPFMLIH